jgi:hypothetical protein
MHAISLTCCNLGFFFVHSLLVQSFFVHFLLAQRTCYFLCLDTKKVTKEKSRLQIILGLLFFSLPTFICSFFARPKNEPKKGAGNDNFNLFWQNSLGFTRPKKAEVHAISGLPTRLKKIILLFDSNDLFPKIL